MLTYNEDNDVCTNVMLGCTLGVKQQQIQWRLLLLLLLLRQRPLWLITLQVTHAANTSAAPIAVAALVLLGARGEEGSEEEEGNQEGALLLVRGCEEVWLPLEHWHDSFGLKPLQPRSATVAGAAAAAFNAHC